MAEKMLVTQALDKWDLLVKKIKDKISKASFVDTIRCNEEKVLEAKILKADYEKQAESLLQQITDLISRFQQIDAAIDASNAKSGIYEEDADFETNLCKKMEQEYQTRVQYLETKNRQRRELQKRCG